jgi:hypothetical protein
MLPSAEGHDALPFLTRPIDLAGSSVVLVADALAIFLVLARATLLGSRHVGGDPADGAGQTKPEPAPRQTTTRCG